MNLLRKLFSRRWLGGTLLVLVAVGLFVRLGIWQLDRLEQRRAENAALQAVLDLPPLDLAEPLPDGPEALENRLATVSGWYDFANERVILLQPWQGRPGVQLITPLMIEGGDTAVLINRGWVPQADYEAGALNQYRFETGLVQVDGYLALSQPGRNGSSEAAGSDLYRVDIPAIEAALPYEVLPIFMVEAPGEAVELEPPLRAAREVDLSEGPHLSYALQWFIFSVLTGGLYLVFVRRSERERPLRPRSAQASPPQNKS
ncbi:SURF1 family protein [Candidatus Leptofilum sp.]|uniref:SURF1 family protein n=1 Tax=Candidatus Leptofilum sp. TaxID=3241576 RepID=UPI003B5CDD32